MEALIFLVTMIGAIILARFFQFDMVKHQIKRAYYEAPHGIPYPLIPSARKVVFSLTVISPEALLFPSDYKRLEPYLHDVSWIND